MSCSSVNISRNARGSPRAFVGDKGSAPAPPPLSTRSSGARPHCYAFAKASLCFAWLLVTITPCLSYRIYVPRTSAKQNISYEPFEPYEQGFVGYYGDSINFQRERINEGAPDTATYPRKFESVYPRQVCPGMVGPLGGGQYYCIGKEYGYCDRRSGTCFCNMGYQGVDCGTCRSSHYRKGSLCYPKQLCPNDCTGHGKIAPTLRDRR
jgi:hypothetical protein